MILGIVGSRRRCSAADKEIVRSVVEHLKPTMIVSGGCPQGADKFAEEIAAEKDIFISVHHPNLPKRGSPRHMYVQAYYARNNLIARQADVLLALVAEDRKGGTENTIEHFVKDKGSAEKVIIA